MCVGNVQHMHERAAPSQKHPTPQLSATETGAYVVCVCVAVSNAPSPKTVQGQAPVCELCVCGAVLHPSTQELNASAMQLWQGGPTLTSGPSSTHTH